jgi:subtilisin family serine protease/subtilisin-like proprotein convertase family protein
LLLAGAVSLTGAEASAVEAIDVVTYALKTPRLVVYSVDSSDLAKDWARGHERDRPGVRVQFSSRVVLQLAKGTTLGQALRESPLKPDREFAPNLFILQAPNVKVALEESQRLAKRPGVLVSHPVRRRPMKKMEPMAPRPNDPLFPTQWPLENRDRESGAILGPELNIREGWAESTGKGVVIAIVDDGVDLAHTEFIDQGVDDLHFNFTNRKANGNPVAQNQTHGTVVAGIAVAKANNGKGIAGVSPDARFASLVVFDADDYFGTEEEIADMFQYRNDRIAVQNHSWGSIPWGSNTSAQLDVMVLEKQAIKRAIEQGRDGKGVVMIRGAGNYRAWGWSAADDGYSNDPRVLTVGAVARTGRVQSFSNMGACVLCAGLIGKGVYSTDRMGALGRNRDSSDDDREVGSYHSLEYPGNSYTLPQIAGQVALILSVNPDLTYRDVQQVFIHASRHFDFADPFLQSNAAGYLFTHNTGYGVPDAGAAVRLAKRWTNVRPLVEKSYKQAFVTQLPDDGLQLRVFANGKENSFVASPSDGLVPDDPIEALPLVDVGRATGPLEVDLTGKAALIERGGTFFSVKTRHAADAGATFAIIYNDRNGDERHIMGGMDFSPIPAVFLSQNDGASVRELMKLADDDPPKAGLSLESSDAVVIVPDELLCEQIGVRVNMTHPVRGDIRLTVQSPAGTRSILQANVPDVTAWRSDWTFWSNQFFYEQAKGKWTVAVSDLVKNFTGALSSVELTVRGTSITDADSDGLDDNWELEYFESLVETALGDPDKDGESNAREQALRTNPAKFNGSFDLRYHRLANGDLRLAWPSWRGFVFRIQSADHVLGPWSGQAVVESGKFQTEWDAKPVAQGVRFYRVQAEFKP